MCGFLAVIGNKRIDSKITSKIDEILKSTEHRGPDNTSKIEIGNNIVFGSNRLSIVDQSDKGNMPFQDQEKRYTLVFNGEIYNYKELKSKLKFQNFKSGNDTEILLYLLIEYGEDIIKELNGMFSFVFFDKITGMIIMGRDRFGIKPFYYSYINNNLIINSDIRTFLYLKDFINIELDARAITSFINLRFIPAPITIFKNILKLEPAHYIKTNVNNITLKPILYWKPSDVLNKNDELDLKYTMKQKIQFAVKNSITGDSNIGVLLSGGLDSSAVYYFAKNTKNTIIPITCEYNISENKTHIDLNKDNSQVNNLINDEQSELVFAKKMISQFNDNLRIININQNDIYKEFNNLIYALGEPMASTDALGHYLLAKNLPKEIKSYIVGTGVDEFMGGYIHLFLDSGKFIEHKKTPKDYLYKFVNYSKNKLATELLNEKYREEEYLINLVNKKMKGYTNFEKLEEGINFHMLFELFFDLPGWELSQADSLYMTFSKEIRPVFLDNNFVDFCISLPSKLKYKNGHEKYLFKEALKEFLPKEIVLRKKLPSLGTPNSVFQTSWFNKKFKNAQKNKFNIFDFSSIANLDFDLKYRIVVLDTWLKEIEKRFNINLQ